MQTDFAIIGGGITGISVAYHLSERVEKSVTVFERERELAGGKTAKSNAVFRPSGSKAIREMKEYGLELYNEVFSAPAADHEDVWYERCDRLEIATTPGTIEKWSKDGKQTHGRYLGPEEIKRTVAFPELDVEEAHGARYYPDAIRFDPNSIVRELVERAQANGVEFKTRTEVTDVVTENGEVTGIETDSETIATNDVISAAGAQNARIAESAGKDIRQHHDIGVLIRIRPYADFNHSFPNLKHAESGIFYTGCADGTVIIGCSGDGYETNERRTPADVPNAIPDEIYERIEDTAEKLVPDLSMETVDVLDEWVGLACKTPDMRPIIGRTEIDGFAVAAFHSEGIQLAPAAGRILTEQLVSGRSASEYPEVMPGRFAE